MSESPMAPERLAELAALPHDDPRREAAMRSPRTAALLLEYERFLAEDGAAGPEALRDAGTRLAAAIDRELGLAPATPAPVPLGRRIAAWLTGPGALRPALAVVVLLVIASTAVLRTRGPAPPTPDPLALRGEAGAVLALTVVEVHDSTTRLLWPAVRGAERYEVEVLGPDLDLVARHATADTTFTLEPADAVPGDVLVRVTAHGPHRPLAVSGLAPVTLR